MLPATRLGPRAPPVRASRRVARRRRTPAPDPTPRARGDPTNVTDPTSRPRPEPRHAVVQFPGGIRASFRWAGSGQAAAVFALSEVGGKLTDYGDLIASEPDALCRAEVHVESPV